MAELPPFVRNAWHLAALSRDVPLGKVRGVTVAGTPIALFRGSDGLRALVDRCPHRNYPLSLGRVAGAGLERRRHDLGVAGVDEIKAQPVIGHHALEDAIGSAVDIVAAHDMIAGLEHQHHGGGGAQPGREGQAVLGALQRGQALLQGRAGRVVGARILIARVPPDGGLGVG